MLWASSPRNALHHSLLWGCYLIFLLLVRTRVRDADHLSNGITVLLVVAAMISLACLVEFLGSVRPINSEFYHRYFVNAEILATLLPILIAFSFVRNSIYGLIVSVLGWSAVVATHSRAIFIGGIVGLIIFFVAGWVAKSPCFKSKRALATVIVLCVATLTFQFVFTGGLPTTFSRLAAQDESSIMSSKLRLVFWGMALEGFKSRPLTGIGGDNFFTDYKTLRQQYSSKNTTDSNLEITEGTIPERSRITSIFKSSRNLGL